MRGERGQMRYIFFSSLDGYQDRALLTPDFLELSKKCLISTNTTLSGCIFSLSEM